MRVTNNIIYNNLLNELNRNLNAYRSTKQIISSERRIHSPSDDPLGIGITTVYRSQKSAFEQYLKNLDEAEKVLRASDSALQNFSNILTRAREIAEQHATGTVTGEQNTIAAYEIQELINSSLELANTKVGSNYIFSGHSLETPTYAGVGRVLPVYAQTSNIYQGSSNISGEYNGVDNKNIEFRIVTAGSYGTAEFQVSEDGGLTWSDSRSVLNTNDIGNGLSLNFQGGTDFAVGDVFRIYIVEGKFQGDGGIIEMNTHHHSRITSNLTAKNFLEDNGYFDKLFRLKIALENGDKNVVAGSLEEISELHKALTIDMVEAGGRLNRIEITRNNLEAAKENMTENIQKIEKPDLIDALTKLAMEENALNASVSILSKIFPNSLINYL